MPNRWFLTDDVNLALCVGYRTDIWPVIVSWLVAVFAAFTAFHLVARLRTERGHASALIWLAAAGLAMGSGLWATQFIGLVAIEIPLPIRFDPQATVLSAAAGVVTATLALHIVTTGTRRGLRAVLAGSILGGGVGLMHYTGMAALQMPAHLLYLPGLFALSIAVAVVFSIAALFALSAPVRLDGRVMPLRRLAAAALVGLAVVLTHVTGMAATYFDPEPALTQAGLTLGAPAMAAATVAATLLVAATALTAALFDLSAESLLTDAVNSFVAGFVIYDADDRLVVCNEGYRQIYRQSASAMQRGTRFEDILRHGLARGQYAVTPGQEAAWLAERLEKHRTAGFDIEQRLSDGTWVLASDRRMRNGGTAGLRIDITAQKTAETALRDSEARLDRAQEMAGIGSWEFDVRTGQRVWSREMYRIRGVVGDDLDPTLRGLDRFTHNEDRARFREWLDRLRAGETPGPIEYRIRRLDGQLRIVRGEGRAVTDAAGVVTKVEGTLRDMTEQRQTEELLLQAQKMETVGQLTGGLAHDFNNIQSAVIGNLDLASSRLPPGAPAANHCGLALDAALRGADLVRRLLAFSRRQPLRPVPTRVDSTIADILPMLRRTLGEQIQMEVRMQPDLWLVMADTAQLQSAILNLVVNARDAMPQGGTLTVTAANTTLRSNLATMSGTLPPNEYVLLQVADTGTGMTAEHLARAFEPFFTTKPPGSGSGLGLSMVFGTMQQLGGAADIASEVGSGTIVRLYLPRTGDRQDHVAAQIDPASPDPTGNERILMVEDNALIREVGRDMLAGLGYEVIMASSGDEAMERIGAGLCFDLLFTDIVMPGTLDGIRLAQAVRARNPAARIVFTSGFASSDALHQQIDMPGTDLLPKPYRQSELARIVRTALNRMPEGAA